ncbi:MAG TPA: fibronectin type III-like domain-contianing protein, partial [Thermoanaerobaculia bacterium]
LKGFERVTLAPGEERRVRFRLSTDDLAFYNGDGELVTEPGAFRVWIGWNAEAGLEDGFEVRGP